MVEGSSKGRCGEFWAIYWSECALQAMFALIRDFLMSKLCYVSCVTGVEMMKPRVEQHPGGLEVCVGHLLYKYTFPVYLTYLILSHSLSLPINLWAHGSFIPLSSKNNQPTSSVCLIIYHETRFTANQSNLRAAYHMKVDISMTCFQDCELITLFKYTSTEHCLRC